jgi:peptidyl-prolyl cis-trans isomerase A (cyclophilin A)
MHGRRIFVVSSALALGAALAACGQRAEPTHAGSDASRSAPAAAERARASPAGADRSAAPAAVEPSSAAASVGAPQPAAADSLEPLPGREQSAPRITQKHTIRMTTTAGDIEIEVYPEAAPNAARRFVELVASGFYDETPISRVVPNFVAQFGINWRAPHKEWQKREFDDDPSYFALERGTLAFAKAGLNSNSTQVFIDYKQNNQLADPRYNFTVFGKVVKGMDVVDRFAQVGDPGGGLDQEKLWEDGGAYLASLDKKPTMIERAVVAD